MAGGLAKFDRAKFEQRVARQSAAAERLRRSVQLAVERSREMGNGMVLFHSGDWWAVKFALDNVNEQRSQRSDHSSDQG